jgi:1,4-alpha-glucan branching enzyme
MLTKLAHNEVVQVTFTTPAMEGCGSLYLVGDFNDWNATTHPMQHNDDGSWSLTLELESGRDYQFRYRTGDGAWHNDPAADAFIANPFGSENSVVRT